GTMSDPKPLLVLWSKAAVVTAGADIATLQNRLTAEACDITSQAHDWFLHALPGNDDGECFVCTGHELPDMWKVFIQSAIYRPMSPIRDDHPDPERRGKIFNFPRQSRTLITRCSPLTRICPDPKANVASVARMSVATSGMIS